MNQTLICDVDGVPADLSTAWLARYNKDYNDNVQSSDIKEWGMHKFLKPECGVKFYDYLEDPTLYDEVLPFDNGCLEFCNNMRSVGWRIVFATVIVIGSAGAKFNWLVRHKYLEDGQLEDYVEMKDKNLLRGAADILIDDGLHNTKSWYESGGTPILFQQPYTINANVPYFHTNDWNKIFDICNGVYSL